MKTYSICVESVQCGQVLVDANSEVEALEIANAMKNNGTLEGNVSWGDDFILVLGDDAEIFEDDEYDDDEDEEEEEE